MKKKSDISIDHSQSLDQSSGAVNKALLLILAVGSYLIATSLKISHTQLLLADQEISLPLVNVPVDLETFYVVAPFIFLCLQIRLTLQLAAHESRVKQIKKSMPGKVWRKQKLVLLPISLFNLSLFSVPKQIVLRLVLKLISFASIVLFPIVTLLFFQISFLPYHHLWITKCHQVLCLISLSLIAYLLFKSERGFPKGQSFWSIAKMFVVILLLYSILVIDFPRTVKDNNKTLLLTGIELNELFDRNLVIKNQKLMTDSIDDLELENLRARRLSNVIHMFALVNKNKELEASEILNEVVLLNNKLIESFKKSAEQGIIVKPKRDLRFATFENVLMRKAKLNDVDFSHAFFSNTDLEGANISRSNFSNTYFYANNLSKLDAYNTIFYNADLEKNNFANSRFYNSDFSYSSTTVCDFKGANLVSIDGRNGDWVLNDLKDANFSFADIRDATFSNNLYKNTNFNQASTLNSTFYGKQHLIKRFKAVFGYSFAKRKIDSERVIESWDSEYLTLRRHFEKLDFYETPAQAFASYERVLKFLISVSIVTDPPNLSREQMDQLSFQDFNVRSIKEGLMGGPIRIPSDIENYCDPDSEYVEKYKKSFIDALPVILTIVRISRNLRSQTELMKVLEESRNNYIGNFFKDCGKKLEIDWPKKIPYLIKSYPTIVVDYLSTEN